MTIDTNILAAASEAEPQAEFSLIISITISVFHENTPMLQHPGQVLCFPCFLGWGMGESHSLPTAELLMTAWRSPCSYATPADYPE